MTENFYSRLIFDQRFVIICECVKDIAQRIIFK